MALDGTPERNPRLPWCRACRQLIGHGEPATRVYFQNDPEGAQGLTGLYHHAVQPALPVARAGGEHESVEQVLVRRPNGRLCDLLAWAGCHAILTRTARH